MIEQIRNYDLGVVLPGGYNLDHWQSPEDLFARENLKEETRKRLRNSMNNVIWYGETGKHYIAYRAKMQEVNDVYKKIGDEFVKADVLYIRVDMKLAEIKVNAEGEWDVDHFNPNITGRFATMLYHRNTHSTLDSAIDHIYSAMGILDEGPL